jgi:hypothetical protein
MGADVISALVPFGVGGLAIAAIVTITMRPKGAANWILGLAMMLVAGVFALNLVWQPKSVQPSPPISSGGSGEVFWFDTSAKADWGGRDLAYTQGHLPRYSSSKGVPLCDASRIGNVVTCWDNRTGGQGPIADNDVSGSDPRWCAYKDSSVRIATPPDGRAPPGQIFVCARYIPR